MASFGMPLWIDLLCPLEELMIKVKTNGKDWKVYRDGEEIGFVLPWDNYGRTWYRGTIIYGLIYSSSFETLEEAVKWIGNKSLDLTRSAG